MEPKISKKQRDSAAKYKLNPQQLAFADLVAVGWSLADAWAMTLRTGITWPKEQLAKEQTLLSEKEGVKDRIADVQKTLRRNQLAKVEKDMEKELKSERSAILARATSKEDKLIEMQSALDRFDVGSPEWVKINQMIIDVSRMKQDEVKEEDTTIHYYLPVNYPTSCKNCLLNKKS